MKKLFLPILFLLLAFSLGCGAGPGINGIASGSSGGKYSNASLNGSYVYHLSGINLSSQVSYEEAGVFTADGNGHITGGIDDATEGTVASIGNTISGSYTISGAGTGTITLTGTAFSGATLIATLVSSSKVYLVEGDALNASGQAELQSSTAISAAPTGTYVFRMHTTSGQGSTATVGQFTISAGIFQSGSADLNHAGVASSPALTNFTLNAPIANGRGTGSFTENPGVTSAFNYYIVDANHIRLLSTDTSSNIGGLGYAEMQTGGPFSASSFAGNYVFASAGDDGDGNDAVNTVGEFTASGGAISSGAFDSVHDGTTINNLPFTASTYTVAANGRVAATFVSSAGTVSKVFWLASPSTAFFLTASDTSDSSLTEDGEADLQTSTSFTNASINGQFALVMHGIASGVFLDRVATLKWDGAGNLSLNEFVNDSGTTNSPGTLTGTYSAASNGRVTGTITSLSAANNDLVFYMISDSDGFVLQEDSGTELIGRVTQQQ